MTHDANGNPTTYKGATLAFDPENRLTSYGTQMTAGYRGDGLRAWKETNGTRTYFIYDGTLPVFETDLTDAGDRTNTFGAHGLVSRSGGVGAQGTSTSSFYTFDAQGNVSQTLNERRQAVSSHAFDAHGVELSAVDANTPFGYGAQWGYYTDHEAGLQLLTHRYYDPQAGRFVTRDPISYRGGINLYAYVGNNPSNFIDPDGTQMRSDRDSSGDVEWARDLQRQINNMPTARGDDRAFTRCYDQNRFSSLFSGIPYAHAAAEFSEIGPPMSLGGDMIATAAKAGGKTLGNPQPYASGLNFIFRRAADAMGNPVVGGSSVRGSLIAIGDVATPVLAVTGTFTLSYNSTIAVECGCGVLK